EVKESLLDKKIEPVILGNGNRIVKQYPNQNSEILTYDKVFLLTNDSQITIPNVSGWSRTEIISLCNMINLKYEFEGYGYVDNQSIAPNSILHPDDVLKLTLKQKFNIKENNSG
ncbi:MAG: hypothetical protein GX190_03915, partial [Mollicutes bacterium]|nr:hypothetical protein [Mollicutes bacterium]